MRCRPKASQRLSRNWTDHGSGGGLLGRAGVEAAPSLRNLDLQGYSSGGVVDRVR